MECIINSLWGKSATDSNKRKHLHEKKIQRWLIDGWGASVICTHTKYCKNEWSKQTYQNRSSSTNLVSQNEGRVSRMKKAKNTLFRIVANKSNSTAIHTSSCWVGSNGSLAESNQPVRKELNDALRAINIICGQMQLRRVPVQKPGFSWLWESVWNLFGGLVNFWQWEFELIAGFPLEAGFVERETVAKLKDQKFNTLGRELFCWENHAKFCNKNGLQRRNFARTHLQRRALHPPAINFCYHP